MNDVDMDGKNLIEAKWRPRFRYFRGHGIHSPFVYSIARNAFMTDRLIGNDSSVYELLIENGINKKISREISNIYYLTECRDMAINDTFEQDKKEGPKLYVFREPYPAGKILKEIKKFDAGCVVCILINGNPLLREVSHNIAAIHEGISIDRKHYFLYFYRKDHKQHYKL